MEIKFKGHFVIEFGLIRGIGNNFGVIPMVVRLCKQIKRVSYPDMGMTQSRSMSRLRIERFSLES